MTPRVLIVEDHPLVAIGLQLALRGRGLEVEITSGPMAATVVELACSFQPQCVLLDIHLGDVLGSGVDLIAPLRNTGAAVVMLTGETHRLVLASCVEAGAEGWIGKDAFLDQVVSSLDDVLAGRPLIGRALREALLDELRLERARLHRTLTPFERLTSSERRVLGALVQGASAEEISQAHVVALTTVRSQIRAILQKLGVRSQLAAVAHANRAGWSAAADNGVEPANVG